MKRGVCHSEDTYLGGEKEKARTFHAVAIDLRSRRQRRHGWELFGFSDSTDPHAGSSTKVLDPMNQDIRVFQLSSDSKCSISQP